MNLRHLSSCLGTSAAVLLALGGCNQTVILSSSSTGGSSSGSASSAASATSSTGSGAGSSGTGTASASASSASSTGGNSGTSTGGSTTGSPNIDGGFIVCAGGDAGDGHPVNWLCPAGTYLCDLSGNPGNCFQCLSDADCRDRGLPTYDPRRLRCDLVSGIPGYQNFCQQCLDSSDCSGNPGGAICDLNPTYPPNAIGALGSSLEPPIETLGFETCQKLQVDCRLDGGPDCAAAGELCDAQTGSCGARSEACAADEDCAGLMTGVQSAAGNGAILLPFCVNGACNACDGGLCPSRYCASDSDCGNPGHSADGLICNSAIGECVCQSSSQCSGPFPVCTGLDGRLADDAGNSEGYCGCANDADCGDAGLACLPGSYVGTANAGFCGVSCAAPAFTSCAAFTQGSVCDRFSGLCQACTADSQCAQDPYAGGGLCTSVELGTQGPCGCLSNADCAAGWSCDAPAPFDGHPSFSLGVCTPATARCTPLSCGGYFCDWRDGGCVNNADVASVPSCIDDFDCVATNPSAAEGPPRFCASGACEECRSNADCRALGQAGLEAATATYCNGSACSTTCNSDADCVGNRYGGGCVSAFNTTLCACNSDKDCSEVPGAPRCYQPSNPGTCECSGDTDCPAGQRCRVDYDTHTSCSGACTSDSDCASGFFCHPSSTCLPRCDNGHSCEAPDMACDLGNVVGKNDGGAIWCYACLGGDDCGGELGCRTHADPPSCTPCSPGVTDCGGGVCIGSDQLCHPSCQSGPCPAGQVCDPLDLAGGGANLCYGCVSAADCPNGEACNHLTHTCGTCAGPTAAGAPSECPPDAVCSNYWGGPSGACLPNCDRAACPLDRPLCRTLPSLTPDHAYCFGCLTDADCADASHGAWCDTSVDLTFTCRPAP